MSTQGIITGFALTSAFLSGCTGPAEVGVSLPVADSPEVAISELVGTGQEFIDAGIIPKSLIDSSRQPEMAEAVDAFNDLIYSNDGFWENRSPSSAQLAGYAAVDSAIGGDPSYSYGHIVLAQGLSYEDDFQGRSQEEIEHTFYGTDLPAATIGYLAATAPDAGVSEGVPSYFMSGSTASDVTNTQSIDDIGGENAAFFREPGETNPTAYYNQHTLQNIDGTTNGIMAYWDVGGLDTNNQLATGADYDVDATRAYMLSINRAYIDSLERLAEQAGYEVEEVSDESDQEVYGEVRLLDSSARFLVTWAP